MKKPSMIDDRATMFSPTCYNCKHLTGFRRCKSFRDIPLEIWNGKNNHHDPYVGDGGYSYQRRKPED